MHGSPDSLRIGPPWEHQEDSRGDCQGPAGQARNGGRGERGLRCNSDLVGFGSGIYGGRHHRLLLEFVDGLPRSDGKQAFIFSTSGGPNGSKSHRRLKEALARKGFAILGEFSCKGFDTFGPFKLIGGLNKGRPNGQDLADAERFARELEDKGSLAPICFIFVIMSNHHLQRR